MPFINNTKKILFIGNARCGSTSMYKKLGDIFKNDDIVNSLNPTRKPYFYHMSLENTLKTFPQTERYFKFCFVRNPWSRFLSFYREFKKPSHHSWSKPILKYNSFESFCLDFNNCELKNDIHFLPQFNQITVLDKSISMDFIGRFETISEDFEKIMNQCNLKTILDIHERNTKSSNYRHMYSEETKKIISEFYKVDVENFGYEF